MEKPIFARVGQVLLVLNRDCRLYPVESFPDWAIGLVKKVVPFNACFWGSAALGRDGEFVGYSHWLQNLSRDTVQEWEKYKDIDGIAVKFMAEPGVVHNYTNSQLQQEKTYHLFMHKVGIEQLCGTYAYNVSTGLMDAISLYRFDPHDSFSEEERQALECLIPNLIEARRTNFLAAKSAPPNQQSAPQFLAASNPKGVLHAVEDGFAKLLQQECPGWLGPRLPDAITALFGKARTEYKGNTLMLTCSPTEDMYLLHARPLCKIDKLSHRQKEVAIAFSNGLSYKELGLSFDLSPATVSNHLTAIYKTLGISNKIELGKMFAGEVPDGDPNGSYLSN